MSDIQSIQVTLELLIRGEDERSEVIWDRAGWLEDNPDHEDLNLLAVKALPELAKYFRHPGWQEDHEAWYYHAPQIVAGNYPLEKLPEGAVRNLAKQMYYKNG
jgi:hypothetical protein